MPIRIFFSYSHRDEAMRDELDKHLSLLKRSDLVEIWHDRRIGAGNEVDSSIDRYLQSADVILLLVSADFLASDYCYDREMMRAMERHEAGEARVIPIILHACDWQSAPFGKLLAAPTDGRPISKWPDRNEAFLDVVKAIREAAQSFAPAVLSRPASTPEDWRSSMTAVLQPVAAANIIDRPRSGNLRAKRSFSDRERDQFRREAFEFIANYFEASLSELTKRNPSIETDFEQVDMHRFMCAAYRNGRLCSEVTIWLSDRKGAWGDIAYASSRTTQSNTTNGWLTIEDDGYSLNLSSKFLNMLGQNDDPPLTFEGAAEVFWDIFIEPLQH